MKYPVLFVLAFLALCGSLFAQNPTSQLNGSVTDPQGIGHWRKDAQEALDAATLLADDGK